MTGAPPSLRPARHDDIVALQEIERAADTRFAGVGHPELADGAVMPDDAAARAIDGGRITVAEVDGVAVGFVVRGMLGAEPSIAQLSVLPTAGRRGVGTALLEHALDEALAGGHATMVLVTQSDVPWNRPFYERRGFEVVPESAWTPAMRAAMDAQATAGLDRATRVQMRRRLRA